MTFEGSTYDWADRQRGLLEQLDTLTAVRMLNSLINVRERAKSDLASFSQKLTAWRAANPGGDPRDYSPARHWLFQQERYLDLIGQMERQLDVYAEAAASSVDQAQRVAMRQAEADTEQAIVGGLGGAKGPAGSMAFAALPTDAIEAAAGFASDGSPLHELFKGRLKGTMDEVQNVMVESVALGRQPRDIATALDNVLTGQHWQNLRIARTETMRAYREAQRMTMLQNADVVAGWTWMSAADGRTCAACFSQHGSVHNIDKVAPGDVPVDNAQHRGLRDTLSGITPAPVGKVDVPGDMRKLGTPATYRRNLRKAERAHWADDDETATFLDPRTGNVILRTEQDEAYRAEGDTGGFVHFTGEDIATLQARPGATMTHNHPGGWNYGPSNLPRTLDGVAWLAAEPGMNPQFNGNSFSSHDVSLAHEMALGELRVTTPTHIHSLKPTPGQPHFDPAKRQEINEVIQRVYMEVRQEFWGKINRGELTPAQAGAMHWNEVWTRISAQTGWVYSTLDTTEEWA